MAVDAGESLPKEVHAGAPAASEAILAETRPNFLAGGRKAPHPYPYCFRCFNSATAAMTVPSSSATGVASHTPFTPPNKTGSTWILTAVNTKDREKASRADTTPLDKDVNIPLANIFIPTNRSDKEHSRFPVTASSYTGLSGRVKTPTSGSVARMDTAVQRTDAPNTKRMLNPISFFSFSWFCSPW